jgi:hypothetical protein
MWLGPRTEDAGLIGSTWPCHEPIAQVPNRGQVLLLGGRGTGVAFDVRRDVDGRDLPEAHEAVRGHEVEELADGLA